MKPFYDYSNLKLLGPNVLSPPLSSTAACVRSNFGQCTGVESTFIVEGPNQQGLVKAWNFACVGYSITFNVSGI